MKAIVVDQISKELSYQDVADPVTTSKEVIIRIHATAVNRADILQRMGKYPVPTGASQILGLEAAGVIESVGAEVKTFQAGEKVFCLLTGGGYAEYVSVPADHLMRIPSNLSFEQAASIPEAFFTAYLNLCQEGDLKSGESVLIHAAASGVGCAAIQLVSVFGAKAYGTAGSKEKCDFVKSLGAVDCVDYKNEDFLKKYGEESIDLIIDMVGQKHLASNLAALKYRGRLVVLSLISGARLEVDLLALLRKNLTIKGSTLRNRKDEEKANLTKSVTDNILPLFQSSQIKPVICKSFPIKDAQFAHKFVEDNLNLGKVVLTVNP